MPTEPYRYRRCPECRSVIAGGDLKPLRYGEGNWRKRGGGLRRCPQCGHIGFTQAFVVVEDKRRQQRLDYGALN